MREDLLSYYERELTFLRQMGAEFAQKYPKIAGRLLLEPDRCEDPHVERLLEAFAFLAARVHLKVDDDFPEITTALLGALYPHYLRPIPSMSIVQMHVDPEQGKLSTGLTVPQGSTLYSREVDGVPCKFRSCYETVLWPVEVVEADWRTPDRLRPPVKATESIAAIRLLLRCPSDVGFGKLHIDRLRFYLNGESNLVHTLYELLCNNCVEVLLRRPDGQKAAVAMPSSVVEPVGFADEECILPYPRRSFAGYRLLQEYFTFPEKFFFVDVSGLEALSGGGFDDTVEMVFLISRFERQDRQQALEVGINPSTFRLGCTPIVNLFSQTAEPILLDQAHFEYPIVADIRRPYAIEVFSVDEVLGSNPRSREVVHYEPFYSHHPAFTDGQAKGAFWNASRRSAGVRGDDRTELYLSLVDLSGRPADPGADTVTVKCTCTNCTLPARLPFGNESGDLQLEGASSVARVVVLRKPTPTLRPPLGKSALWRLISHLSLNYLSLADDGREALQQILALYNFSDSPYLQNQIQGITGVRSSRHFARVITDSGMTATRGTRVEVQFDEDQFVGGGVYLFACVLEQFLGSYVSMNSFTQLAATTAQRKETLKEWPPRAGRLILI